MDEHPEIKSALKSEGESSHVIPPPDLSRPPPSPPSPMDSLPPPQSSPAPRMDAGGPVILKKRGGGDDSAEESSAHGLAAFNTRAAAAVIDCVVAVGITVGLDLILPGFAHRLAWLTGMAYMVTRDSLPFLGGQSVGKKAMKLRAVTLEGKSLTGNWEKALIRNGVLIIPFFAIVELVVLLTREDKPERGHRLGDEWAKTQVIIEEKPAPPESE